MRAEHLPACEWRFLQHTPTITRAINAAAHTPAVDPAITFVEI